MTKIKSNFFITFALNHLLKSIKNENNKIIKSSLSFYSKKKFEFDPVTKFDLSIEKILRSEIEKIFPDHSVIGEELENKIKNSGYTWILDPIDGTKAYLWGNQLGVTLYRFTRIKSKSLELHTILIFLRLIILMKKIHLLLIRK